MKKILGLLFVFALAGIVKVGAVEAVQASLTWTGDGVSQQRVERRDGPDTAPWTTQAFPAVGIQSFNQAGLSLGTRYCYRVVQFNSFGDAPTATNPVACGTPDVPLNVNGLSVIFAP